MNWAEKKIRGDFINAVIDGWSDFVRERLPAGPRLVERLRFALDHAVMMGGAVPLAELAPLLGTPESTRKMAYDLARTKPEMGTWLLGSDGPPN